MESSGASGLSAPLTRLRRMGGGGLRRRPSRRYYVWMEMTSGMIRIATMFVILIIGLIAGPAVSL